METGDTVLPFEKSGLRYQFNLGSISKLVSPHCITLNEPVVGLSNNTTNSPLLTRFPFIFDIYHDKIIENNEEMICCDKCGAIHNLFCPFCSKESFKEHSFSIFRKNTIESVFVFIVVGDVSNQILDSLLSFPFPFYLGQYNELFTFCKLSNNHYHHIKLVESEIPPDCLLSNPKSHIPNFEPSKISRADFNMILSSLLTILPKMDSCHIVLVNSLPHECVKSSLPQGFSLSIINTNCIECDCSKVSRESGGLYLPYAKSLPSKITAIQSISLQTQNGKETNVNPVLVFQGSLLTHISSIIQPTEYKQPIQIVVKSSNGVYVFTLSIGKACGIKTFLYNASMANFLLLPNFSTKAFGQLLSQYGESKKEIIIPFSLRYFPLYHSQVIGRTLLQFLSQRPFVYQILPSIKVQEYVTRNLVSSHTMFLMLYHSVFYIYVGNSVSSSDCLLFLGQAIPKNHESFPVSFSQRIPESPLWRQINEIQSKFNDYELPIMVVPNESGRRVELLDILECDEINGNNIIAQKYSEIADVLYKSK